MFKVKALGTFLDSFNHVSAAISPLLNNLLDTVDSARTSSDASLLRGHMYRTLHSVESPQRVPWYVPAFSLDTRLLNVDEMAGSLPGFILANIVSSGAEHSPTRTFFGTAISLCKPFFGISRVCLTGSLTVPKLRERVIGASDLLPALDAIGELDALRSLAKLRDRFGSSGWMAEFVDGGIYSLRARQMHNATLLLSGMSVANDLDIRGGMVTMLTGANSGGKTTVVTGILQNQILAQLGSAVAAQDMTLTVAD